MTSPPPATPATPSGPNALDSLVASMGMTQLLIVAGALLLVAIELLLGIIARQYFIGHLPWFAAAAIVLAMLASRMSSRLLPFSYQTVLLVGAFIIAIVGVHDIVDDGISVLSSPGAWDAVELLGFALYVVAVVAVVLGLWMMLRGKR